ncbi:MAG: class I SAM-dependent methyltransferase [Chitinispirillaceae bacterium]|nr:class I SAM-dependent methyltransferase [Chitinispirillaceae bacterium]
MEKNEYEVMYRLENSYWWYAGLHELVARFCEKARLRAAGPLRIIDAGCGTGRMMELLARFGTIEGFDFSEEAVRFCAERGLSRVTRQDINEWKPQTGAYDVIISLDVLCHKSVRSEQEMLNRCFAALAKGGVLILNLPAFELLKRRHDAAVHTRKRYRKKEVVGMLQTAGFEKIYATYRLPWIFFIMLSKKMLEKAMGDRSSGSDLRPLPGWLNGLLLLVNRFENTLISDEISMPLGGSLFVVAQKS